LQGVVNGVAPPEYTSVVQEEKQQQEARGMVSVEK
jgi:hypothetical protein